MTKIIHLSDLHFGTENIEILKTLPEAINLLVPDIIIITGDFTQRAKTSQFKAAQDFIKRLNCKHILCVPGNHDIPLYNVILRFLSPFRKYKKFISEDLNPIYCDPNLLMIGVNSVTPFKVMDGYVNQIQLQRIRDFFDKQREQSGIKTIFMHHNIIQPKLHKVIINLEEVLHVLANCGVELILSGHLHDAFIEKIERPFIDYNMYIITAGTALSNRLRSQPQSFNLMKINALFFTSQVYSFENSDFVAGTTNTFKF